MTDDSEPAPLRLLPCPEDIRLDVPETDGTALEQVLRWLRSGPEADGATARFGNYI